MDVSLYNEVLRIPKKKKDCVCNQHFALHVRFHLKALIKQKNISNND